MKSRSIWVWLGIAASLFAFIFLYQRHQHQLPPGPPRVLPAFQAAKVTSVQVRPAGSGQLRIRAERTNATWQLTEPLSYPAQAASIDGLLSFLERLTAATYLTYGEIRNRPKADEEFGFTSPLATLFLEQDHTQIQVLIGARTAPGDQVYLQVVTSDQGIFVVDAELLKYIPRSANDWRDTTLIKLDRLAYDHLAVTNNVKAEAGLSGPSAASSTLILQRGGTNGLWGMIWPLHQARADTARIEDALHNLQGLRIQQFVSDDPKPDLEAVGLAPAELELRLSQGSNTVAWLQFGHAVTNDAKQVYARRAGQNAIFTVAADALAAWRAPANEFRDPHLLSLSAPVETIDVRGRDRFALRRHTNDTWQVVLPNGSSFAADALVMRDLVDTLSGLKIGFVKDAVNPAEWPEFGLGNPLLEYRLRDGSANVSGAISNALLAEIHFGRGTNQADRIFARRTDESSVYSVATNDFARLPTASWELRQRKYWDFSETNVVRLTIRQQGKQRQLVRTGQYAWSLAPGSQGIINDLAVEETVRGVAQAAAVAWVARGEAARGCYGLTEGSHQLTFEMKDGRKLTVEFGGEAPSTNVYAAVTLDGEPWIMEFPWIVYRDVLAYLSVH